MLRDFVQIFSLLTVAVFKNLLYTMASITEEGKKVATRYVDFLYGHLSLKKSYPAATEKQTRLMYRKLEKVQHEATAGSIKGRIDKKLMLDKVHIYDCSYGKPTTLDAAVDLVKREKRDLLVLTHMDVMCPLEAVDEAEAFANTAALLKLANKLLDRDTNFLVVGFVDPLIQLNPGFEKDDSVGEDKEPLP